jgi:hypothetical protein
VWFLKKTHLSRETQTWSGFVFSGNRTAWNGFMWIKQETTVEWICVVQKSKHPGVYTYFSKEGPVLNFEVI